VLRTTTQPSLSAVFSPGLPSSLRTRCDFVSGKLILSVRCLAQRRTASSRRRGERHGLSVMCHRPTEHACYFFSPACLRVKRTFGTLALLSLACLLAAASLPSCAVRLPCPRAPLADLLQRRLGIFCCQPLHLRVACCSRCARKPKDTLHAPSLSKQKVHLKASAMSFKRL
jgi:hypothetical protein